MVTVCVPFQEPRWICQESAVDACSSVEEGYVGSVIFQYSSYYWQCEPTTDLSCDNVPDGWLGIYTGGDGTDCNCSKVTAPSYTCNERAQGTCSSMIPAPAFGDEGDLFVNGIDDSAGYCRAGYWTCEETVLDSGACKTVKYKGTDANISPDGFLGDYKDGDYFEDGTCMCRFVAEPVAKVDTTTGLEALTFQQILDAARLKDGWIRTLPDPGERMITKPAVLGGLALFSTYVPSDDTCAFGGYSYLWGLYYETGTAYGKQTFDIDNFSVPERVYLGLGKASSVGIHVGTQEGNKASTFVQLSTGVIKDNKVDPPFKIRSGYEYWLEN